MFSQCPIPGARAQAPSSKFQTPNKHQVPSSNTNLRAVCAGHCLGFGVLRLETSLELGVGAWCFARPWLTNCEATGCSLSANTASSVRSRLFDLVLFAAVRPRTRFRLLVEI